MMNNFVYLILLAGPILLQIITPNMFTIYIIHKTNVLLSAQS